MNTNIRTYLHTYLHSCLRIKKLRVSQGECARHREGVPYVKVYRYNPKHLVQI